DSGTGHKWIGHPNIEMKLIESIKALKPLNEAFFRQFKSLYHFKFWEQIQPRLDDPELTNKVKTFPLLTGIDLIIMALNNLRYGTRSTRIQQSWVKFLMKASEYEEDQGER